MLCHFEFTELNDELVEGFLSFDKDNFNEANSNGESTLADVDESSSSICGHR